MFENHHFLVDMRTIGCPGSPAKTKILRVVFKDSGFKDDVVKTNAIQILRQAGIDDVKRL